MKEGFGSAIRFGLQESGLPNDKDRADGGE